MKFRQVYESLVSLSFNLMGLIAGALLASSYSLFSEFSWAIVLYPGILSVRGALGGLFSGRISTALHLGTIRPTLKDNTKSAYNLLNSIIVLTLVSSLVMSVLGSVTCLLSGYIGLVTVPRIFVTMVTTMGLSIILISPFTYWFSVFSFNRGLDPDKLVYPVVSTFSDIVITGCYVIMLWSVIHFPVFSLVAQLGDPKYKLVISHQAGDEGLGYRDYLLEMAEDAKVDLRFVEDQVGDRRGLTADGRKIYTLSDLYQSAAMVTYPSLYEGFGNAFLETIYYRVPMLVNRYSIFARDIEPKGFRGPVMSGYLTKDIVDQVRWLLEDSDYCRDVVEHNHEVATRFYSYSVLRRHLRTLITNITGLEAL